MCVRMRMCAGSYRPRLIDLRFQRTARRAALATSCTNTHLNSSRKTCTSHADTCAVLGSRAMATVCFVRWRLAPLSAANRTATVRCGPPSSRRYEPTGESIVTSWATSTWRNIYRTWPSLRRTVENRRYTSCVKCTGSK